MIQTNDEKKPAFYKDNSHKNDLSLNSSNNEKIDFNAEDRNLEMIGITCSILEMSIRRGIADCETTYKEMGSTLVLLLLKVIECCLESSRTEADNGELVLLRGAVLGLNKATEIICHVSRLSLPVRESIASIPGVLSILIRLAESTITPESQVNAYCAIANLSCEPNNVSQLASEPGLMRLLQYQSRGKRLSNCYLSSSTNYLFDVMKHHSVFALMNISSSREVKALLLCEGTFIGSMFTMLKSFKDEPELFRFALSICYNLADPEQFVAASLVSFRNSEVIRILLNIIKTYETYDDVDMRKLLSTLERLVRNIDESIFSQLPSIIGILGPFIIKCDREGPVLIAASILKGLSFDIFASPREDQEALNINEVLIATHYSIIEEKKHSMSMVILEIALGLSSQWNNPKCREFLIRRKDPLRQIAKLSKVPSCTEAVKSMITIAFREIKSHRYQIELDVITNILTYGTPNKDLFLLVHEIVLNVDDGNILAKNEALMIALVKESMSSLDSDREMVVVARNILRDLMDKLNSL